MKKSKRQAYIALVLTFSLLFTAPAGAATLADVPIGHWAYEAVNTLVEKGYLLVGDDQLFRGDQPADRYTLATVVAKILTEIESGRVSTTPEDVRTLRLLVDELRADLVEYYANVDQVRGEVAGVYDELIAYDELLVKTIAQLGDLYGRATDLEAALAANAAAADQRLQAEVSALRSSIDTLAASLGLDLQVLRGLIDSLGEELDRRSYDLNSAQAIIRQDLASLSAQTQGLEQSTEALREMTQLLENEDAELRKQDEELRQEIAKLAESLKAEAAFFVGETARLTTLIAEERSERQSAVQKVISDLDQLQSVVDVLKDLISQHSSELAEQLEGQADETTDRITELRTAIDAIADDLASNASATAQSLARLEADLASLTGDTKAHIARLETELADQATTTAATLALLESELADTASATDAKIGRLESDLADTASATDAKIARLESELAQTATATDARIARLESDLAANASATAQSISRLELDLAENASLTAETIARLQADLATISSATAANIASLEADSADTASATATRIAGLESNLASLASDAAAEFTRLQAELASMAKAAEANVARLESEIAANADATEGEIARLESELAQNAAATAASLARLEAELATTASSTAEGFARLESDLAETARSISANIARLESDLAENASVTAANIARLESGLADSTSATAESIARLEKLIAETREGVYDNVEGLVFLSHSLDQAEQKRDELAERVAQISQDTSDQFLAVEQVLGEIRGHLEAQGSDIAASELNLERLENDLEEIRAQLALEIQALGTDMTAASEALARVDGQLLATIEQLRQEIAATKQTGADTVARVAELEAALNSVQLSLLGQIDALAAESASMQRDIGGLRQDLLMLQSQVGLSEEQVHELTQRVKEDMANQLTLTLVREGELQRALDDLRSEFDSYRATSEQQLKGASSAQALGIGALILGLIGLFK